MLLVRWDGASTTLCGFAVVLGVPWERLRVAAVQHTHSHVYTHTISKHSALNSLVFKKLCKSSCKKGKLLLEMDPSCLQRVKTLAAGLLRWIPGDEE